MAVGDESEGDEGADDRQGTPSVFTVCLNTDPYTYLGTRGLSLAPAATLDRPLSLVSFRDLRLGTVATTLAGAAGLRAAAGRSPSVTTVDDVEAAGEATEVAVRHHPAAMDLVVPLGSPALA